MSMCFFSELNYKKSKIKDIRNLGGGGEGGLQGLQAGFWIIDLLVAVHPRKGF